MIVIVPVGFGLRRLCRVMSCVRSAARGSARLRWFRSAELREGVLVLPRARASVPCLSPPWRLDCDGSVARSVVDGGRVHRLQMRMDCMHHPGVFNNMNAIARREREERSRVTIPIISGS